MIVKRCVLGQLTCHDGWPRRYYWVHQSLHLGWLQQSQCYHLRSAKSQVCYRGFSISLRGFVPSTCSRRAFVEIISLKACIQCTQVWMHWMHTFRHIPGCAVWSLTRLKPHLHLRRKEFESNLGQALCIHLGWLRRGGRAVDKKILYAPSPSSLIRMLGYFLVYFLVVFYIPCRNSGLIPWVFP